MSEEQNKTVEVEKGTQTAILNRHNHQFCSLSIGKDELYRLFKKLEQHTEEAKRIELTVLKSKTQNNEIYAKDKKVIDNSFRLTVTVTGTDSQELAGLVDDVFDSVNFPEDIKSIYVANDSTLRSEYNYTPLNFMQIYFDFSKPSMFDLSQVVSHATPDPVTITVIGYDVIWVNGVFGEITSSLKKYPSQLNFIHNNGIYDVFLVLLFIPIGFWICSKFASILESLFSFSVFVKNMSYVYMYAVAIYGFFLLFRYARWIFPLIEYRSQKNQAINHRAIITVVLITIVASAVWDILKTVF